MGEIKNPESSEIKKGGSENFTEIKPEKGMTPEKAKEFWDNKYEDMHAIGGFADGGVRKIDCPNEELAGKEQPITHVPFERKIIDVYGEKCEVVVPIFDSKFEAQLSEDKLKASDYVQFKECNGQLKNELENNKELFQKFTPEQIEQIKNGDTPDGYVWHHDAEVGKMQLVDAVVHQKTHHKGGAAIWGGRGE